MDLKSTKFERFEYDTPGTPGPPTGRAAPPRGAVPGPRAAVSMARSRFLIAEGQSATPLELETLLGTDDTVEASFLDRCQLVTRCIGRVRFSAPGGRGYATGFMIAPGLMLTNHHVFGDENAARGATIEFDYRFNVAGQLPAITDTFDLAPDEFFAADEGLDFAVVAVQQQADNGATLERRGYLRLYPDSGKVKESEFVTIIQYPGGEPLRIALRENEVTRAQDNESSIWYRADTAHGSSGAPVFNDSFQVAALHASGRIKRNDKGEYALRKGGWVASIDGLDESDVIWEANVGYRVSGICAKLMELATARSAEHADRLAAAMRSGDVLTRAVERLKQGQAMQGQTLDEIREGESTMPPRQDVQNTTSPTSSAGQLIVPLQLRISLEAAGTAAVQQVIRTPAGKTDLLEAEAFQLKIPVIYDELEKRKGFNRKFLGTDAPMPKLTADGEKVAAPLLDGSGVELKYHKFSVWIHKQRRIALFTASNVDWTARKKEIDGQKLTRENLAGFPPNSHFAEQWVNDERIAAEHQLPDVFYTEDRGAFDKGHLVRRDDVCWGTSFQDIQMGNGDTYHVTNCSPQIKAFNQGAEGEENWGDLESFVQKATKEEKEKVVIYAGPVFGAADRWFRGKDDAGGVKVQIPNRFWKIVVAPAKDGGGKLEAFGFILDQDVRAITEKEFFVTEEWVGSLKRINEIEALLRGWVSLSDLVAIDAFDSVK